MKTAAPKRNALSHAIAGAARGAALLSLALTVFVSGCNSSFRMGSLQPIPTSPQPPTSPPPTPSQIGSITISPTVAAIAPGQTVQFSATVASGSGQVSSGGGQVVWLVNGVPGGNATTGTVSANGLYTAPATIAQSENVIVTAELSASATQNHATAVVSILNAAAVTCPFQLGNPLVALYSMYLPAPGTMQVNFGTTTNYGLETWAQPTPPSSSSSSISYGGEVPVYVAGMKASTNYHMRALVTLEDGATYQDVDHQCPTGQAPTPIATVTVSGTPPQSGIEMWNTLEPPTNVQAFATDLEGNVIWAYAYTHTQNDYLQGIQLLPNGNLLTLISYLSSVNPAQIPNPIDEIREINLAGNTVASLTMSDLNTALAASSLRDLDGNPYKLGSFHHDVLPLPNGHFILLATDIKQITLPGQSSPTTVIGDALVEVDQNFQHPGWAWNTFDHPKHLPITRHPMNWPDWTHSNMLLYSQDDGNLLLSMRHQNWIIKIDFEDGAGPGDVLWRLGYQSPDFQLLDSSGNPDNNPADWFYAQHGMSFFSMSTAGQFEIGMMDNGNDRTFSTGQVQCKPYAGSAQCYSTMPLLLVDENAKTATMIAHYMPGPSYFSFFGGNADLLANGDYEVDFCAPKQGAIVQELDPQSLQPVWQATTPGADQYHAYRWPSLYPKVQWKWQ